MLPLGEAVECTNQPKIAGLRDYPGANAEFTLYQDDGRTYAYEKEDSQITRLHWNDATPSPGCSMPRNEASSEAPRIPQRLLPCVIFTTKCEN